MPMRGGALAEGDWFSECIRGQGVVGKQGGRGGHLLQACYRPRRLIQISVANKLLLKAFVIESGAKKRKTRLERRASTRIGRSRPCCDW